jgi:DNA repair protein RadC
MCAWLFPLSMDNDETKKSSAKIPYEFKVMRVRECPFPTEIIDTPERAVAYWRQHIITADWYDESKEALVVLILNTRRRIIGHNLVSLGNLDSCSVRPLEVFRPVIVAAGGGIILIHNHPSGESSPSDGDIKVTCELIRASQLLKIEILDHVIVGKEFHSLRALGYFTA